MEVQLKRLTNNKIIGVMAHGKSIEELENRIEEFRNFDICWVSIGVFDLMETFILSKINKHLSIVQDCSEVEYAIEYEQRIRFPKVKEFLLRPEANQFMTADVVLENMYKIGQKGFLEQPPIENKIFSIPKEMYRVVPNGMALLLVYLALGGAKKIIIFGMDGYKGDPKDAFPSYYRTKERTEERMVAFRSLEKSGLHSDTFTFNSEFNQFYMKCCMEKGINPIPIINCSTKSLINCFPLSSYDRVIEDLK